MFGSCMLIKVKPIGGAQIKRLDDHLTQRAPAAVDQSLMNGQFFYEAAPDGTYDVRVFDTDSMAVGIVKSIIKHNGFEVISEVTHEE